MAKDKYIDNVVLRLKRKYGKDELVQHLIKKTEEQDIEIGKLKAEIDHLEANIPHKEINAKAKAINKADINYQNLLNQNKRLRQRVKALRKNNEELIIKLSKERLNY